MTSCLGYILLWGTYVPPSPPPSPLCPPPDSRVLTGLHFRPRQFKRQRNLISLYFLFVFACVCTWLCCRMHISHMWHISLSSLPLFSRVVCVWAGHAYRHAQTHTSCFGVLRMLVCVFVLLLYVSLGLFCWSPCLCVCTCACLFMCVRRLQVHVAVGAGPLLFRHR